MNTTHDYVPENPKKPITCDQVAWLNDALDRYRDAIILSNQVPGVSRNKQVARIAATLEIMEIFGLQFEDKGAAGNALSQLPEFQKLREIDPLQQVPNARSFADA